MRQLSGMDASFVYLEAPRAPMHIGSIAIYDPSTAPDGKVTFKGILEHITGRMPLVPSYREKLARVPLDLDHPYWVNDPDFDLEFHVRHIALPKPGDWRQLCIQAARLHARELDLDRPLWEFYVIEGLDNVEGVPPGLVRAREQGAPRRHRRRVRRRDDRGDPRPHARRPRKPDVDDTFTRPSRCRTPSSCWRVPASTTPPSRCKFARLARRTMRYDAAQHRRAAVGAAGRAAHAVQRRDHPAPRHRRRVVRPRAEMQADQVGGAGRDDQRRRRRRRHRCAPPLPRGQGRAARHADGGDGADLGSHRGRVGDDGQPGLGDDRRACRSTISDPLERLKTVYANTQASKEMTNAIGARTLSDYSQFVPWALAGLATRTASRFSLANRRQHADQHRHHERAGPADAALHGRRPDGGAVRHGPGHRRHGHHPPRLLLQRRRSRSRSRRAGRCCPTRPFYAECLPASFDELVAATR